MPYLQKMWHYFCGYNFTRCDMENIKYKIDKNIPLDKFDVLMNASDWRTRGIESWREIISKSTFLVTAWDNDTLIGMARTVDDTRMCMVYDVVVSPKYRKNKIGTNIMNILCSEIRKKEYNFVNLFVDISNLATADFYKKLGFKAIAGGMQLS